MVNFTISLPNGTTNHGNPKLVCTPATMQDLFVFYVTNYFIHAATLPTGPGESKEETLFAILNALFIPGFGVLRAIRRLVMYPSLRRGLSPVDRACASGALCMILHKNTIDAFKTATGDEKALISDEVVASARWAAETFQGTLNNTRFLPVREIHGLCETPEDYLLCVVPFGVQLKPVSGPATEAKKPYVLSSDYSVVKALFSLVQIVVGSITIYRSRGDQITQYGYASFGLSVVPYVFMSVVNAIATVCAPTFPTMYMIRTPDMDRAERDGGHFEGVVAELVPGKPAEEYKVGETKPEKVPSTINERPWTLLYIVLIFLLSLAVPLGIVGGLSGHFGQGLRSTRAQRGWIMSWMLVGSLSSLVALFFQLSLRFAPPTNENYGWMLFIALCIVAPFWVPAIGGMVSVSGQLREYGICTRFD
ncbi:hypothetical protein V8F33_002273 [Rhypophila sp. PSN 637]